MTVQQIRSGDCVVERRQGESRVEEPTKMRDDEGDLSSLSDGDLVALHDGPLGAFDVTCLPAALRNRPERISEVIRAKMRGENCRRSEGRRRLPPGASGRIDLERGKRGSG
jgi:hypothetical protein